MSCAHVNCTKENAKEIRPKVFWWRCPNCGLEVERDERPLDEINFFDDDGDPKASAACVPVRAILRSAGVEVAQDILDLGCTGLVATFAERGEQGWVSAAQTVRGGMAGAGFGLPCYVPPQLFCLVHSCIGALEPGQEGKHPEGRARCSRELTAEEVKMAAAMDILTQGKPQAEEAPAVEMPTMAPPDSPIALYDGFACPEHREPVWRCRYCLAVAVISGDFEPMTVVRTVSDLGEGVFRDGDQLDVELKDRPAAAAVELYVRAAVWQRKMVRG